MQWLCAHGVTQKGATADVLQQASLESSSLTFLCLFSCSFSPLIVSCSLTQPHPCMDDLLLLANANAMLECTVPSGLRYAAVLWKSGLLASGRYPGWIPRVANSLPKSNRIRSANVAYCIGCLIFFTYRIISNFRAWTLSRLAPLLGTHCWTRCWLPHLLAAHSL